MNGVCFTDYIEVELALDIAQEEVIEGGRVEISVLISDGVSIERDFDITLSIQSNGKQVNKLFSNTHYSVIINV